MARLVFAISSAYMRLALRVYFTLVLSVVSLIGDRCCTKRVKLWLLRNRRVPMSQMTGWLGGSQAALALLSLRTSPAGWLGLLMLLTSLLWIAGDLAVSGLVSTVEVVSRCPFNTTGLIQVMSVKHVDDYFEITNVGPLFDLITQAQKTSLNNGGLDGIYAKVNADTNFRADRHDVLGQWTCEGTGQDVSFAADASPATVSNDLQYRGFLFDESTYQCWTVHPDGSINRLVAWSADQPERPTGPWDVRAAIDVTADPHEEKVMKTYTCHMDAPSIDWVLAKTVTTDALSGWCEVLSGALWAHYGADIIASDPETIVASALNNIVMNAGGAWNDTVSPIIIQNPTQGCLAPRAVVPWPLILLFAIVTILLLFFLVYWLFLSVQTALLQRSAGTGYWNADDVAPPSGLLTWMQQAVRETRSTQAVTVKSLKQWSFGRGRNGVSASIARTENDYSGVDGEYSGAEMLADAPKR